MITYIKVALMPSENKDAPIGQYVDTGNLIQRFGLNQRFGLSKDLYVCSTETQPQIGDYIICCGGEHNSNETFQETASKGRIMKFTGEEMGIIKIIAATDKSLGLPLLTEKAIENFIELYNSGYPIEKIIATEFFEL